MLPKTIKDLALPDGFFLAVAFGKSRSPYFRMAVGIAERSPVYRYDEEMDMHIAGFTLNESSIKQCYQLLRVTFDWKGSFVATGKEIITTRRASFILECLIKGTHLENYCEDYQKLNGEEIKVPCKMIYGLYQYPAQNIEDSYKQALADSQCDWCPRFNGTPLQTLPQQTQFQDKS